MKVIKLNQKLILKKITIAQLDANQMKMVEGGGIGKTNDCTNTCECTWKTCGCTYTCNPDVPTLQ